MPSAATLHTPPADDAPPPLVSVIVFDRRERIVDELDVADGDLSEPEVWLDFAKVETVTSTELSALIRFTLRMRRLGKSVYVCHVGPNVEEIFKITRFPFQRIA